MSTILNIETSSFSANICISKGYNCLNYKIASEHEHTSAFLHNAIQQMIQTMNISFDMLDAIHLYAGPGSYTGLRIGYAAAKGMCYVLQKPFITSSLFDILSHIHFIQNASLQNLAIIDNARVDEWYFAYFENNIIKCTPCIQSTQQLIEFMEHHKCDIVSPHPIQESILPISNINTVPINSQIMITLGCDSLLQRRFTDIYDSEPFYCKEAYIKSK